MKLRKLTLNLDQLMQAGQQVVQEVDTNSVAPRSRLLTHFSVLSRNVEDSHRECGYEVPANRLRCVLPTPFSLRFARLQQTTYDNLQTFEKLG
jgi:hypothetical protein